MGMSTIESLERLRVISMESSGLSSNPHGVPGHRFKCVLAIAEPSKRRLHADYSQFASGPISMGIKGVAVIGSSMFGKIAARALLLTKFQAPSVRR